MDNRPPVDRSLFIPIIIAGFSVLGILLVLVAIRLGAARGVVDTSATNTPVKFQYLGTEPLVALPTEAPPATEEETELPATVAPTTDSGDFITLPAITLPVTSTFPPVRATNTSAVVTSTNQPLGSSYDDADLTLAYTGNWVAQSGLSNVYKSTLHLSNTIGDAVQFTFYGQKIRFVYQAGPSLGTVAIRLDSSDYTLDQSATETGSGEWESPVLTLANHTITITHISGGSINLDSLVVVDISTPTVTVTPTP
jgi:hypothetical protein